MIHHRFFGAIATAIAALFAAGLSAQSGPVVHFTFDDQRDPTVDIVGGHKGVLRNGATFSATDKAPTPGNVAALDLRNGSAFLQIAHAALFNFGTTQPMSFTMWLKLTQQRGIYHYIGKRVGCAQGTTHYQGVRDGPNNLRFGTGDYPVQWSSVPTGRELFLNTWTHLAFTFDGTEMLAYWDGSQVGSSKGYTWYRPNTADLLLGSTGTCPTSETFPGLMDDFRLYLRALAPCEVAALAKSGSTGSYTVFGTSCPGTNNKLPLHRGVGAPTLGIGVSWEVTDALPLSVAILTLGWWNQKLDIKLDDQGMKGCSLYAFPSIMVPMPIDVSGRAALTIPLGCDPTVEGATVHTQVLCWDTGAPHRWPFSMTNGLTTIVGKPR